MIGHCVRLQVGQSLDTVSDFKSTSSQTIVGHCVGLQVGQSLDTVSDFKSTSSQTIVGHCVGLQVDFKSDNRWTLCQTSSQLQVRQSLRMERPFSRTDRFFSHVFSIFVSKASQTIVRHCVGLQVGQSLDTVPDFKSTSSETIVGHFVGLQVDFKSENRWTMCRTSSRRRRSGTLCPNRWICFAQVRISKCVA